MDQATVYVLNDALTAVKLERSLRADSETGAIASIPAGAELQYHRPAFTRGAVTVLWNRQEYMIFESDLEVRASQRPN